MSVYELQRSGDKTTITFNGGAIVTIEGCEFGFLGKKWRTGRPALPLFTRLGSTYSEDRSPGDKEFLRVYRIATDFRIFIYYDRKGIVTSFLLDGA